MPGKKVTVKEMKHDGLVDAVASTAGFFERHRLLIALVAVLVVTGAVIFTVVSYRTSYRRTEAARALSEARTGSDLAAVYEKYPETPSAPLALLQHGAFAFSAGDYVPARTAYLLFRERYPDHILADFAQMGIASSLEAESRWDEAIEAYRLVGEFHPESALVPEAEFNRARCFQNAGRPGEALLAYRNLYERFPQNPYAFLARNEWAALRHSQ